MPMDDPDGETSKKQTVGDHEGEYKEAQDVESLHYESDRDNDEEEHEIVQKGTGRLGFAPPVIGFQRIYFHL